MIISSYLDSGIRTSTYCSSQSISMIFQNCCPVLARWALLLIAVRLWFGHLSSKYSWSASCTHLCCHCIGKFWFFPSPWKTLLRLCLNSCLRNTLLIIVKALLKINLQIFSFLAILISAIICYLLIIQLKVFNDSTLNLMNWKYSYCYLA